jgi:hypothetical protein
MMPIMLVSPDTTHGLTEQLAVISGIVGFVGHDQEREQDS